MFLPLLIKSKKEVILQHLDEKNLKNFSSSNSSRGKNYTLMLLLFYLLLFLLVAVSVEKFH